MAWHPVASGSDMRFARGSNDAVCVAAAGVNYFSDDRQCHLPWRRRPDVQTNGSRKPCDRQLIQPGRPQAGEALVQLTTRAEHPDIACRRLQGWDQSAFILFEIVSRHGDGRPAVRRRIVHGLCKGPPIIGYANGRMGLRSEWSENGYVPADGLAEPRNRKCKGIGADDHQPLTRKVMTDDQGWRGVIAMFLRNAFS